MAVVESLDIVPGEDLGHVDTKLFLPFRRLSAIHGLRRGISRDLTMRILANGKTWANSEQISREVGLGAVKPVFEQAGGVLHDPKEPIDISVTYRQGTVSPDRSMYSQETWHFDFPHNLAGGGIQERGVLVWSQVPPLVASAHLEDGELEAFYKINPFEQISTDALHAYIEGRRNQADSPWEIRQLDTNRMIDTTTTLHSAGRHEGHVIVPREMVAVSTMEADKQTLYQL